MSKLKTVEDKLTDINWDKFPLSMTTGDVHEEMSRMLIEDRHAIHTLLRKIISNQLAFELDENGDPLLRKHDILTLIDELFSDKTDTK